ncbi:HPr kinase/phosphorylase [Pigmentiphaga humi]|uniref:HPr kinase/phosphorylase n=2 Tax=Pigmentiphaga humi TaxID=2478468 RepID=A0A3P4B181_9BURK|nr:HPr kinase/phosphorylase [Pigmentiphaga humi]
MHYRAHQLLLRSEIALHELLPATGGVDGQTPDVTIRLGRVGTDGWADEHRCGPRLWTSPGRLRLQVPGVATFLVEHGRTIVVEPDQGADDGSIRLFLLGSAMGALLHQRGLLVLHGNAIQIGDRCMVCVGQSGMGKSTLAAGFMRRGHSILADDVTPVTRDGLALPGMPRVKLWQDVADRLGIATTGLRRIRPNVEKFNYPLGGQFSAQPLPLRWVYLLERGDGEAVHVEPLRGVGRFTVLREHTYRLRYVEGMKQGPGHLRACSELAGRIRLARVRRPTEGFRLDALIDALLADMAAHP